jgi:glycosyltransferase involved in cell wall biosynthesis
MKKLLVIMPLYNEEEFVERAVNSIINQTFKNFVLCIINDCSTDSSLEKIKKYLDNPKIRLINNETNMGAYYSRNIGLQILEKEDFDVYTVHDADNFSDSTRFEKLISFFEDQTLLCVEDYDLRIGGIPPSWLTKPGEILPNCAHAFYSKEAFKVLGYFDDSLFGADMEYWHRLLRYVNINSNYSVHRVNELLHYSQITGNNLITKYGNDVRELYFNEHMTKIKNMKKEKDFYKGFFINS